jgi:hypothetical protein
MPARRAANKCIVPGCNRNAVNNLGVRLRKLPQADAWWSPNANAYVCDTHAAAGARITLIYEPTTSGKVETCVHAVAGEPVVRRTNIN